VSQLSTPIPGSMSRNGKSTPDAWIAPGASTSGAMTIRPSIRPRMTRRAAISSSVSACELDSNRCRPSFRALRSMPRITSEKNSPNRSGNNTPMAFVRFVIRLRATPFGQ
jgi:hypothetical protein